MWLISLQFSGSLDCFLLGTTSGDAWGLLLRAPQVGMALKDLSQGSRWGVAELLPEGHRRQQPLADCSPIVHALNSHV